jgi:arsenate reductase
MIVIYHNGECSKCKGALELLQEKNIPYEARWYLAEPLSVGELKDVLQKLGMKAEDIVRRKEPLYSEKYEGKNISNEGWLKILTEEPILMERPIVVNGDRAIVARPPERVLEII